MARIRVFIFEDDEGFSDVLRALVATVPGFEVVGCSPRADEGLREFGRLAPDLVLLDMHLAQGGGFEVMENPAQIGTTVDQGLCNHQRLEPRAAKCLPGFRRRRLLRQGGLCDAARTPRAPYSSSRARPRR